MKKKFPKWVIPLIALFAILMIDSVVYPHIDGVLYSWGLFFVMFACFWSVLLLVAHDIEEKHPTVATLLRSFVFLQMAAGVIIVIVFVRQGVSPVVRRG